MKNFRSRTVNAISWSMASKALAQIISFAYGVVLARLLNPEDFGLIAMVLVVMGFAGLLSDIGLGSALIQKSDVTEDHFSSVFWLYSFIGLLLAVSVAMVAPYIADFYKRPELTLITRVLSVNYFIGALAIIPRAKLGKKLEFRELAMIDMFCMIFSGGVAVVMALLGYGYWSLVVQRLVRNITNTILIWITGRWLPKIRHNFGSIKDLFSFSSNVFLTQSIRYAAVQADNLLIGKFLDAAALGLYDKAYSMMLFPLQNISQVIGGVLFPSLSLIQNDLARVRAVYLRTTAAISLFTYPMMAGMFVVADSFVFGVLGKQWLGIVPLLRLFCVVGFFNSISTITGSIYLSQGESKLQLKVNLVNQPLQIAGAITGLFWGVYGVAIGFSVTTIIGAFITWRVAGKLVGLNLKQILLNLLPSAILSTIMGVGVWLLGIMLRGDNSLLSFVIQVVGGITIYVVLLVIAKPPAYKDILNVISQRKRGSDES